MRYELILRLPFDEELLAVIKAGARLRPKVMTVATAIAGLLPIFCSTRTGVEVAGWVVSRRLEPNGQALSRRP